MPTSLSDPNNHVPEVTPDDVWGDPAGLQAASNGLVTVLPAKRSKMDSSSPTVGADSAGIRIGGAAVARPIEEKESRLEVQEIDGTVVRLAPEEPSAPKMPRNFTFQERPAKARVDPMQRGESRDWGLGRRHSVRWIIGTGVGVATLVVLAMMLLPLVNQSNAARPRQGDNALVLDTTDEVKGAEALNAMLSRQPEAEQLFRKFASAAIVDDVLPLLRDPDQAEPLIRKRGWKALVPKEWVPPETTTWSVYDVEGIPYGVLAGTLPDYTQFNAYFLLKDDHLHLDWKATTSYGTAAFEELAKGGGDPVEIRAMIAPCGYFTATYPEAEYQSYQFVSTESDSVVWCYTRKGGEADRALAAVFQDGAILKSTPEPRKVTLRLKRGPADSFPNQWLVDEIINTDWIIP